MSQYLDGHRVLKIGCNGRESLHDTFLRHRLAAKLARVLSKISFHQPIRGTACIPHVCDHWLCSTSETTLIAYHALLRFMLIVSYSPTRNLPSVTKPHAHDTSPTSRDVTTAGAVEIYFVIYIHYTQFPLIRMQITIRKARKFARASIVGPTTVAGRLHDRAARTARRAKKLSKHRPSAVGNQREL
jgi:hypothetical protein